MSQELTTAERQALFNVLLDDRRVDLPDDTWSRVLDTMRVPASDRVAAEWHVSRILTVGLILFGNDQEWAQRRASAQRLAEVGTIARNLKSKMLNLDNRAKLWFELSRAAIEIGFEPDADARDRMTDDALLGITVSALLGRFERYEQELWNIACTAAAAPDRLRWPLKSRPPKRLFDCPQIVAFEITVVHLCAAGARNGWNLALSHNTESGPLIDVIRTIEPHMPPGFVPRVLNADRLRSLRNRGRNYP